MKSFVLILISLMLTVGVQAQKLLKTDEVPGLVQKRFTRKYRSAKKVKWFKENKTGYLVKFEVDELKGEAHLDKDGVILKSKLEVEYETIPKRSQVYIKENYKRMKVENSYKAAEGRKDQYYIVILHKSQGRKKPPLVYEVQFDRVGRFLTDFKPEVKEEVEEDKDDEEFLDDVDNEGNERVSDDMKIRKSDLPSGVTDYLKANYNYEYKAKEILYKKSKKYGQCYYVVMKKQGEKFRYVHYFDLNGKLIKKIKQPIKKK